MLGGKSRAVVRGRPECNLKDWTDACDPPEKPAPKPRIWLRPTRVLARFACFRFNPKGSAPSARSFFMYIRFAQDRRDPVCRVAPGLFHAFHRLPPFDREDWRHHEINRLYRWFNRNLDVPERLSARVGRFAPRRGVCWFADEAGEHVSNARYLAWLLSDIGVPIEELRSPRPGALSWEDPHQVVVIPERHAPVTIH